MPVKKNPLENARKRVEEKLSNIEEQSEFICQFISDLVKKVCWSLYKVSDLEQCSLVTGRQFCTVVE